MLRPDDTARRCPARTAAASASGTRSSATCKTLPQQELARLIQTLEEEMHEASADLRFEYAARLRDEITDLRRELRDAG